MLKSSSNSLCLSKIILKNLKKVLNQSVFHLRNQENIMLLKMKVRPIQIIIIIILINLIRKVKANLIFHWMTRKANMKWISIMKWKMKWILIILWTRIHKIRLIEFRFRKNKNNLRLIIIIINVVNSKYSY